tara:strand:+ start:358 stop:915 length:558 start_codon:yes stop_codon:yes gene_type:complete
MKTDHKDIVAIGEWMPLSDLPSKGSKLMDEMNCEFGKTGVYQVAAESEIDNIGDSIVHPEVGYTGMSRNIHLRTYTMRRPNGDHTVSRYIRLNELDNKDYFVRMLYTDVDPKDLEREIHDASEKEFGDRFKWKNTSDGNDGNLSKVLDLRKKLDSDELIRAVIAFKEEYFERSKQEATEHWKEAV